MCYILFKAPGGKGASPDKLVFCSQVKHWSYSVVTWFPTIWKASFICITFCSVLMAVYLDQTFWSLWRYFLLTLWKVGLDPLNADEFSSCIWQCLCIFCTLWFPFKCTWRKEWHLYSRKMHYFSLFPLMCFLVRFFCAVFKTTSQKQTYENWQVTNHVTAGITEYAAAPLHLKKAKHWCRCWDKCRGNWKVRKWLPPVSLMLRIDQYFYLNMCMRTKRKPEHDGVSRFHCNCVLKDSRVCHHS